MKQHQEKAFRGGETTATEIRQMKFQLGKIIGVPYKTGFGVEYHQYKIIGNYPDYVLCERETPRGKYTKCFLKSELYFKTIEMEDEDDR